MRIPVTAVAAITACLLLPGFAVADAAGAGRTPHPSRHVCSAPAHGYLACDAILRTDSQAATPDATAGGYGPADLQDAYKLPSATAGTGQTVAVVDAFDQPTAESDLATYRSEFGLPPCTTANGCFRKIGESGSSTLPSPDAGWGTEIDLDLDMVSASCPKCNILLVEANSASLDDLGTAVNTAVASGAKFVSNSYGGSEGSAETQADSEYFNHPGVVITVAAGDSGFGVEYPAASRFVTAVGGTSLARAAGTRGWSETAWSGGGSGCSAIEAKPTWQHDTGCAMRTVADISADADPNTGVAVFDNTPFTDPTTHQTFVGWLVFGGTSVAAPLAAGMYALAGTPSAGTYPAAYPYSRTGNFNDITSGSNGSCSVAYLCNSGPGYDGPTGVGTPNGTVGLEAIDPILAYYQSLGGPASFLGNETGPETNVAGGLVQPYQGGSIFYSSATGPHVVIGAILAKYNDMRGPAGVLGFPTSDEQGTADGTARFNTFAGTGGSALYWTPNTGAHSIQGAIYAHFTAQGGEATLGAPTTDEQGTPDGTGRYNHFTNDASIYWTPNTGAQAIHGAIRDKWASLGWERSPLGYPTSDEQGTADGTARFNTFAGTGGSALYWTPNTGAHSIQGAIYAHFTAQGGEATLGAPTTDEQGTPDGTGRYNHFTNDASIYWTPNTGAQAIHGAIRDKWASLGWERSPLGYPTSDEFAVTGGRQNTFQHGTITWISATNTTQVTLD